jgi:hypothetical protein
MTHYPTGVVQNMAPPNCPLEIEKVPQSNWRMFSNEADADQGLGMIDSICDNASMVDAETLGGMYSQYLYLIKDSTIRCRVVNAVAQDSEGRMRICEYPSDILDRDSKPFPMVDLYTEGQPHTLKVRRITRDLGQLYWDAA